MVQVLEIIRESLANYIWNRSPEYTHGRDKHCLLPPRRDCKTSSVSSYAQYERLEDSALSFRTACCEPK